MRSSPSPANSTAGTVDSDGWDAGFADISSGVPLPGDRCFGHLQPSLLQRAKPSNFLLDRKKTDKLKKKKKRRRRDGEAPGKEGYVGSLLKLEPADPYAETPTSPPLQGMPAAPADPCSGWDSDTPSSGSCATVSPDQVTEIKTEGKRTVVRQGKQVVFRDEDSTGNDEDIMVDSGERAAGGSRSPGRSLPSAPASREKGQAGGHRRREGVIAARGSGGPTSMYANSAAPVPTHRAPGPQRWAPFRCPDRTLGGRRHREGQLGSGSAVPPEGGS